MLSILPSVLFGVVASRARGAELALGGAIPPWIRTPLVLFGVRIHGLEAFVVLEYLVFLEGGAVLGPFLQGQARAKLLLPTALLEDLLDEGVEVLVLRIGELDVAVGPHTRTGRDEVADDDVLLEPAKGIGSPCDGRVGENAGRFLEGGGGEEGVDLEARLG